jgi:hypothetical protein
MSREDKTFSLEGPDRYHRAVQIYRLLDAADPPFTTTRRKDPASFEIIFDTLEGYDRAFIILFYELPEVLP